MRLSDIARSKALSAISLAFHTLLYGCVTLGGVQTHPNVLTDQTVSRTYGLTPLWVVDTKPYQKVMANSPIETSIPGISTDGRSVVVGSSKGELTLFESTSGRVLWSSPTDQGIVGQPLIDGDLIFVGDSSGSLNCYAKSDGKLVWRSSVKGVITKQPLSTNGVIIVRDGTNTVYAFERDSGRWQWQVSRDSPTDFSMQGQGALFLNTDQLLVGYSDGFLVSYSVSKGGKKLWSVPIGESQEDFRDLDGNLGFWRQYLAVGTPSTGVTLVDTNRGVIHARIPIDGAFHVLSHGDLLVVTTVDNQIRLVDPQSNESVWHLDLGTDRGSITQVGHFEGKIVLSFDRGGLMWLDPNTGTRIGYYKPGTGTTGFAIHRDKSLLVTSTHWGRTSLLASRGHAPSKNGEYLTPSILTGSQ